MKLYIKQKAFSWRDKFTIKDDNGADRWFAQGESFSSGRKLRLYDAFGNEAAFIRQKTMSFQPRYFIELGGAVYTVKSEFTFMHTRISIEGVPWKMNGDAWAHKFELYDDMGAIMRISKRGFIWGDSYELDILNPDHELLCLCIALTVECMQADESEAAMITSMFF
ncbi:MAG: LURP-one-related family protein [Peptococcaceae bacterium]|nr:LURP-one-related family protein [Peptococcaceae bacterium]